MVTVTFNEIDGSFTFATGAEAFNFATDNELSFETVKEHSKK
jgi:hypothetical protein